MASSPLNLNDGFWHPQPGTQSSAILAQWCDELFFGGSRGGGKSDYLLGDFLQGVGVGYDDRWRGIMFRKTYLELEELQIRAAELFPGYGGIYKVQSSVEFPFSNCWYFPGGETLKMRYLKSDKDAENYQGHQYCVAVGTKILMADGSSKSIEDIEIGDYVATLEGGKKVTHKVKPYFAPCCELKGDGIIQTHPIWHPVLTDSGWKSYASILDIDSREFAEKFQEFSQHPSVNLTVKLAERVKRLDIQSHKSTQHHSSCKQNELFGEKCSVPLMPSEWCIYDHLPSHEFYSLNPDSLTPVAAHDAKEGALNGSQQAQDYQWNCLSDFHQCGEQSPCQTNICPNAVPLQGGVASRSRVSYMLDVRGNIPSHNHQNEHGYLHPYALEERLTEWESSLMACELSYVGHKLVADITVQDANHYITYNQGIINKNTWIGFDELTNHASPSAYDKLKACLRIQGVPKRIRSSGNPGGKGHIWVKQRFIDAMPPWTPIKDPETGLVRMFIPSRITDNQYLRNDKQYMALLRSSGSSELVRAWLEGDWDIVAGAYFDNWRKEKHVIRPFSIPSDWTRFRSFDWGSAKPFSVGWWAISDGSILPRNALIRYREWYGMKSGEYNVGLKMTAEAVAQGIAKREKGEQIAYGVADPAIWIVDGGESIAERMLKCGIGFRRADNQRIAGWDQLRQRLDGEDGEPMIYFFDTCVDTIRTLPALQHDENNLEDVDSEMEDHAADDVRYACMSRPFIREVKRRKKAAEPGTIAWVYQNSREEKKVSKYRSG